MQPFESGAPNPTPLELLPYCLQTNKNITHTFTDEERKSLTTCKPAKDETEKLFANEVCEYWWAFETDLFCVLTCFFVFSVATGCSFLFYFYFYFYYNYNYYFNDCDFTGMVTRPRFLLRKRLPSHSLLVSPSTTPVCSILNLFFSWYIYIYMYLNMHIYYIFFVHGAYRCCFCLRVQSQTCLNMNSFS